MATLQDFRNERLKKLGKLRALGVDPYPSKTDRTSKNSEVKLNFEELEGRNVKVVGRIKNLRIMGKIGFIVIKDGSDSLQLFAAEDALSSADYANSELAFKDLRLLDSGDFVEGDGEVIKTKTGEISVKLNKIRILTKAIRPMPLAHEEFSDIESRYRQRYIDMNVNEDVKNDIILRSKVTQILREFLVERDFLEIETPVLQPIYGGASAKPFTTYHNKLESDFFLRISPELYLKKAIAGGFERVFEFSRNFRNEGIDRSHNPEFTMLEFYRTYTDYNDLMEMTTEMMHDLLSKIFGKLSFDYQGYKLDFSTIKKYTFRELILEKTGLDIDSASREDVIKEIKSRGIEVDLRAPTKDLLDEFYKETCRKDIIQPIYLIDYPREMIPLAKRKSDNPKYIESLQLVCCGFELLKAYSELNDPIDQLERLTEDQKALDDGTSEEAMTVDLDFIAALEVGIPPTAGWGMGIDRLVSFLADKPAIKDVIMFPTLRPEETDEVTKKMYPQVKFNTHDKSRQDFGRRMVLVVSDNIQNWQVANTVCHMSAYLGRKIDHFETGQYFETKNGTKFPRNTQYPIVIKVASSKELVELYRAADDSKLIHHGFIKEMIETTNDKKIEEALKSKDVKDVELYGVGVFGDNDNIKSLTSEFELWNGGV